MHDQHQPARIVRAYGELRRATARYLEQHHYMASAGGSGQMFAVVRRDAHDGEEVCGAVLIGATASRNASRSIAGGDEAVCGAVLIGPTASQDAERSIAGAGVTVRQIKRSHLLDNVAMYESHLLRHAMQEVCDEYDAPVVFVSYADPAAIDTRSGLPLLGHVYLAAGFFFAGETTGRRWCVIDHHGRARSTRQGAITLRRATLPRAGEIFHGETVTADWQLAPLPPARIWIAVVTPSRMTRRQAKIAWRATWAQLNPQRQVAAKLWIDHVHWRRLARAGKQAIGEPKPEHIRALDRFQPAWWHGKELRRTAAPVWVPALVQQRLIDDAAIAGETTARRHYAPLRAGAEWTHPFEACYNRRSYQA